MYHLSAYFFPSSQLSTASNLGWPLVEAQLFINRFFEDGVMYNGHVKPQSEFLWELDIYSWNADGAKQHQAIILYIYYNNLFICMEKISTS